MLLLLKLALSQHQGRYLTNISRSVLQSPHMSYQKIDNNEESIPMSKHKVCCITVSVFLTLTAILGERTCHLLTSKLSCIVIYYNHQKILENILKVLT